MIIQLIGWLGMAAFLISYQMKSNRVLFAFQALGAALFCLQFFFMHAFTGCLNLGLTLLRSLLLGKYRFQRWKCILGAVPTIIYSFVYLVMVVIVKWWNDFYGFTFGGRYELIPEVFVVIYSVMLAASVLLIRGHNRMIG